MSNEIVVVLFVEGATVDVGGEPLSVADGTVATFVTNFGQPIPITGDKPGEIRHVRREVRDGKVCAVGYGVLTGGAS